MRFKVWCFCAIILASFSYSNSAKYGKISDCYFYNMGLIFGGDKLTFICAQEVKNIVFIESEKFHCTNNDMDLSNLWPGEVSFEDCKFQRIELNFFKKFPLLRVFNISDVDLETFPTREMQDAKNITKFYASHNRLKEIPALAFVNANNLRLIDFSNNTIQKVDDVAFASATNLESLDLSQNDLSEFGDQILKPLFNLRSLNLSYNKISKFDFEFLVAPNLLALDLANNKLSALNANSFHNITNLVILNLSFNPIGNLNVTTFAFLLNLQILNLRHTNISSIEMGTFSHQHNLVTLDLSENALKMLDFKLFFPIMHDLRSLYLGENQLVDLQGFRNSLFPKLNLLDMKNNLFNCSYLEHFMETVNWEHLRIALDPKSVNLREPNIRGIKCKKTKQNDKDDNNNPINDSLTRESNVSSVTVILICLVIVMVFGIIIAANRNQIYYKIRRLTNNQQDTNIEYANEICNDSH